MMVVGRNGIVRMPLQKRSLRCTLLKGMNESNSFMHSTLPSFLPSSIGSRPEDFEVRVCVADERGRKGGDPVVVDAGPVEHELRQAPVVVERVRQVPARDERQRPPTELQTLQALVEEVPRQRCRVVVVVVVGTETAGTENVVVVVVVIVAVAVVVVVLPPLPLLPTPTRCGGGVPRG